MLFMPIVVLFYEDNGLTAHHIFILQAIYSVAIVGFEIPSGYAADVLGRKKTLVVGSILGFLGFATYSISNGFTGFLIAEVILGMGSSLISGADSAMLYDSLIAQKREKEYLKLEGRITSIGNFSEATAGILGGFLATLSLRYPYIGQACIAFLAIPASLTLVEPERVKQRLKLNLIDIVRIFKFAIIDDKDLRSNILFSSITGCSTLTMAWFAQFYFEAIHLPVAMFGVVWTLLNLTVGLSSLVAHKVERKLGQVKTVTSITLILGTCYIAMGIFQAYWGLALLFVFYLVRGVATPVLKDYINKITDSEIRATVLSVRNFIIRLLFAAIGPALGYLTGTYSLKLALVLAGSIFSFFSLITLFFFVKSLNTKTS